MRMHDEGRWAWLALAALFLIAVPAVVADDAAGEDVEVSTTFLTFFKNGGGYIEYRINGQAAADLRGMIDDPAVRFPYETMLADGDGLVDPSEGEQYMRNLDDILTRRQIVLRGVKLDNVDVDDHRGLIGSNVNDTRELYIHITFRGNLQYDQMEFNVSGLEPLMVLYGSYEDIPRHLTVDEHTYIVSAGTGSYSIISKGEGSLLNLRVPLASVVSYHNSYTVSNVPTSRMEYDHSTSLGNPLVLMVLVFIVTILALKLPKSVARDNGKERVRGLHIGILVTVVLFWLFYTLGGHAVLVWGFGIGLAVGSYYFAHLIYAKDWMGMAQSLEGIDLGDALVASDPVNGAPGASNPDVRVAPIIGSAGPARIDGSASDDVMLVVGDDAAAEDDLDYVQPVQVPSREDLREPPWSAGPQQVGPSTQTPQPQQVPPVQQTAAVPVVRKEVAATPSGTRTMRCKCGGTFKVPLQPRPLTVTCPHCGTSGVLKG